jgi:hypothetical protein
LISELLIVILILLLILFIIIIFILILIDVLRSARRDGGGDDRDRFYGCRTDRDKSPPDSVYNATAFHSFASQEYTFRSRKDLTPSVMAMLVRSPRLTGQYSWVLESRMA